MSLNIHPMAGFVVAEKEKPETKTASGILLPESAAEKTDIAKIVAVGKEVNQVKVGDRIIYKSYSDTTKSIKVGSDELVVLKENDILATVK